MNLTFSFFLPRDYNQLRNHFKSDHYLCEDGNCVNEQFTSAFRSELDLKAHRIDRHSGGLSKTENRLNRIVGIDVSFSDNRQRDRRQGGGGQSRGSKKMSCDNLDFMMWEISNNFIIIP